MRITSPQLQGSGPTRKSGLQNTTKLPGLHVLVALESDVAAKVPSSDVRGKTTNLALDTRAHPMIFVGSAVAG